MFKHTIEYTDFNGQERKEDFYFHLASHEVVRVEAELGTSLKIYTEQLAASGDVKKLVDFLEKMLLSSYGKKSPDGKSFVKRQDIREEFEYSQAYAELFEQILLNPELARKFGAAVADNGKDKKNQVSPQVVNQPQ